MKILKRMAVVALAVFSLLSFSACEKRPVVENETELGQAINLTGSYLRRKNLDPRYGDEYVMLGLLRSGYIDYWDDRSRKYQSSTNNFIKQHGNTIGTKDEIYADKYPLVMYAYTACGIYADKTSNRDLTRGISYDSIVLKGGYINKINCLTAVLCGGSGEGSYNMFEDGDLTKQDLVDFTLGLQKEDGSFDYKGREDSVLKITSSAVVALSLAYQNGIDTSEAVSTAIDKGVEYLKANAKPTDTIDDLMNSIIALNTAGVDARDVNGNDLIKGLLMHRYSDGSFAENTTDKKGNEADAALALCAIASQYRFENGQTSFYDMSDVLGGTHNQLSPLWTKYVNFMKYALGFIVIVVLALFFVSRRRIRRWKADGTYDPRTGNRIVPANADEEQIRKALRERDKKSYFDDEPEETAPEEKGETQPEEAEMAEDKGDGQPTEAENPRE